MIEVRRLIGLAGLVCAGLLGPAAQGLAGDELKCARCVDKGDIAKRAVDTSRIKPGAVTTNRLEDGAVVNAKIADDAVTSGKIAAGAVTADKLGSDVTALGLGGVAVVPAAAFIPITESQDYAIDIATGFLQPGSAVASATLSAPLHLPDGVVISELEAILYDDSANGDVDVELINLDLSSGTATSMASAGTTGPDQLASIQALSETTITQSTVDAVDKTYYLTVDLGGDLADPQNTRLYAVRVYYQ